jgi:hypothetical protein
VGKSIIPLVALASLVLASFAVRVQTVEGEHTPDGRGCPMFSGVNFNSPGNTTYPYNTLTLSVSVRSLFSPQTYTFTLVNSIDGEANATMPVTSTFVPVIATRTYANGTTENVISSFASYYLISGIVALPELPVGSHSLTVYGTYDRFNDENTNWPKVILDKSTVGFTVSAIAALHSTVTTPPTASDNTTSNTSTDSNQTISASEPSETDVVANQPISTWQTGTSYSLAAALSVLLIVVTLVFFAKRKRQTERDAPFPHKK